MSRVDPVNLRWTGGRWTGGVDRATIVWGRARPESFGGGSGMGWRVGLGPANHRWGVRSGLGPHGGTNLQDVRWWKGPQPRPGVGRVNGGWRDVGVVASPRFDVDRWWGAWGSTPAGARERGVFLHALAWDRVRGFGGKARGRGVGIGMGRRDVRCSGSVGSSLGSVRSRGYWACRCRSPVSVPRRPGSQRPRIRRCRGWGSAWGSDIGDGPRSRVIFRNQVSKNRGGLPMIPRLFSEM